MTLHVAPCNCFCCQCRLQLTRTRGTCTLRGRYPRPALTVDAVIVSQPAEGRPSQLLLIKRKNDPFKVGHIFEGHSNSMPWVGGRLQWMAAGTRPNCWARISPVFVMRTGSGECRALQRP